MELQVDIPSSPPHNFNFSNSGRSTPYTTTTAPTTPKAFGGDLYFLSAPTSPSRASDFYREFEDYSKINHNYASQPASPGRSETTADDFSFQVSVEPADSFPVSAHELFDGGRIRPAPDGIFRTPTGSPKKKSSTTTFWEALTPKKKGRHTTTPFESDSNQQQQVMMMRGREKTVVSKSGSRRGARSLSPHRELSSNFGYHHNPWIVEHEQKPPPPTKSNQDSNPETQQTRSTTLGSIVLQKKSSRGWRLKDFLLFRSASEGRASDKDPLRKYSTLFYKKLDEKSNSSSSSSSSIGSFRSRDRDGSTSKRMVSAHEMHYTANKAVSEDRKKKTFLPYKERILGRFPF